MKVHFCGEGGVSRWRHVTHLIAIHNPSLVCVRRSDMNAKINCSEELLHEFTVAKKNTKTNKKWGAFLSELVKKSVVLSAYPSSQLLLSASTVFFQRLRVRRMKTFSVTTTDLRANPGSGFVSANKHAACVRDVMTSLTLWCNCDVTCRDARDAVEFLSEAGRLRRAN